MTTSEQNDAIRAQVDAELPRPVGGFENSDDEQRWRDAQEARFFELVGASAFGRLGGKAKSAAISSLRMVNLLQ